MWSVYCRDSRSLLLQKAPPSNGRMSMARLPFSLTYARAAVLRVSRQMEIRQSYTALVPTRQLYTGCVVCYLLPVTTFKK